MLFFSKPQDRFYPLPGTRQRFWVSPCGTIALDALVHDLKNITLDRETWPDDAIKCEMLDNQLVYCFPEAIEHHAEYPSVFEDVDNGRVYVAAWVVSIAALKGFYIDPWYFRMVEPIYLNGDISNPSPCNLAYRFKEPVESDFYPGTRIIPGFTRYSISADGTELYSHESNRINHGGLKSAPYDDHGYRHANPSNDAGSGKTCGIHRLVALAWVTDYTPWHLIKGHVDHIDTNRTNNHYTNLQWLTSSENVVKGRLDAKRRLRGEIPLYDYREVKQTNVVKEVWYSEETKHLFEGNTVTVFGSVKRTIEEDQKLELMNIKTKEVLSFPSIKDLCEFIGRTHAVVYNAIRKIAAGHWTVLANEWLLRIDDRPWPDPDVVDLEHRNANGRFTILVKEPGKEEVEEWFSASKLFREKGISRKLGFRALKQKNQGPIGGILMKIKGDETPWVA